MVKFDVGSGTLTALSRRTRGAGDDLGSLIKQLIAAAEPLEGRFNGAGKTAFDAFKRHSDEVTADLNGSLAAICGGQQGMDRSFATGETAMAEDTRTAMGTADFHAARFRSV